MRFDPALIPATLVRRYKRFLADVVLSDGRELTVHTPNTGSMLGCAEPGIRVWIRDTQSQTRKYRYSWDVSEPQPGVFVGVHTGFANRLVREAIENQVVPQLQGYRTIRAEVPYGKERSRIDLCLEHPQRPPCFVEVKNVTAVATRRVAVFPDAVTQRGTRHLRELAHMVDSGNRAVLFFCIQRDDVDAVSAAAHIDPEYAKTLAWAVRQGVEVLAFKAAINPQEVSLISPVPLQL